MLFPIIFMTALAASAIASSHPAQEYGSAVDYVSELADDGVLELDYDDGPSYDDDEGDWDADSEEIFRLFARSSADMADQYEDGDIGYLCEDDDDNWIAESEPVFNSAERMRTSWIPDEENDDIHELLRRDDGYDDSSFEYLDHVVTNDEEFDDEVIPVFNWAALAGSTDARAASSSAAKVTPVPTPAPSASPALKACSSPTVGATAGNRPATDM
ncbi:hypothetical protein B9Z65_160 [Elsinoe australis]|uniref:Uncharacterized protein n=1 Tax=Elsinoe australis TaxID=40998 RepID=A0A2P7Z7J4_9PEZI|nr:hypothetical protein B9Z65_160 [Elsinoe australis]